MGKTKAKLIAFVGVTLLVPAAATVAMTSSHAGNPDGSGIQAHLIPLVSNPCLRLAAGSGVENPPALFSHNGVLMPNFSYQTTTDEAGRTLFCFMTPDGLENPTLHVHLGDNLIINVTNNTPAAPVEMEIKPPNCGATEMTNSSVNIHFHGTNTSPTCHQDDVIHTVVNSGRTFLSLNFIPIAYPDYTPAVVEMRPGEKQLWRTVNASADTILDLQPQYDGEAQNLAGGCRKTSAGSKRLSDPGIGTEQAGGTETDGSRTARDRSLRDAGGLLSGLRRRRSRAVICARLCEDCLE